MNDGLVLVDSSAWVWALRPGGPPAVRNRVAALLAERRVATAAIVIAELLSGAADESEYAALHDEFSALPLLGIDATTWTMTARLAFALRRKGVTIPITDALIASVARQHGVTLLHTDRHFGFAAQHAPDLLVESLVSVIS